MNQPAKIIKGNGYILYKENGIICAVFDKEAIVGLDMLQACIRERIALANGVPHPIYIDATGVKYWTLEARKYGSSPEALTNAIAYGILLNSAILRTIVNWSSKIYPPKNSPLKVFTDKVKALEWLEQFKK